MSAAGFPAATDVPAEPWHLRGEMYLSLWSVPVNALPAWSLPPGVRPLVARGRCAVVTFWVDYSAAGDLSYRELLVALAVRHTGRRGHREGPRAAGGPGRLGGTAVAAWVDSERALAGGRALWGIPKEPGRFSFEPAGSLHSARDGGPRGRRG
ncbi:acetoacetate decarboxylase family protein, partial [Streptomyces sp. PU-14G]|uniref:acetoacetate decarboxylase family protein n=1 Tax=Streptomyces sp. PU-14G TaxID=2800808 RepID=UPI0034DEB1C9